MIGYYITPQGAYYEGDQADWQDAEAPQRPDADHQWNGNAWVFVPPPVVIRPVSPRQIRQALTRVGLRAQVEAAVAAGDQDLKDWYEYSTTFERVNPQVEAMGAALGVSSDGLDNLWQLAASL